MKIYYSSLDNKTVFWLIFIIVLITRLPLLNTGSYGMDFDAWLVVDAANQISSSYKYVASRLPGYPVQELFYSIIPTSNPLIYNLITALISSIGIAYFGLILKKLNSQVYIFGAVALAMTPVYYINSVNSMDYLWALSFILASFYYLTDKKYITSGILLGFAVGSRITSGAALFPFLLVVIYYEGFSFGKIARMALSALIVSLVCFIPVFYEYGLGFFTFYDEAYPNILEIIKKMTYFIWGVIGFIMLLPLLLNFIKNIIKSKVNFKYPNLFFIIYFALFLYAYFRFPKEPEYLLPIIPFFIIILAKYLNEKLFKIFSIAMIFASFFISVRLGDFEVHTLYHTQVHFAGKQLDFAIDGPVIINYKRKKEEMEYLNNVMAELDNLKSKSIIIAGWDKNKLSVLYENTNNNVQLFIYPDIEEINSFINKGIKIYYLSRAAHTEQLYSEIKNKMQLLL